MLFCLIVTSARLATIPVVRHLVIYYITCGFQGYNASVFDVAVNAWVLDLWREKCNTYMQSIHFSGGLGMAAGPLILAYFVGINPAMNQESELTDQQRDPYTIHIPINGSTELPEPEDVPLGRFSVPFILAGLVGTLCTCFQIYLYFMEEKAIANHEFSGGLKEEIELAGIEVQKIEPKDEKVETNETKQSKCAQSKLVLVLGSLITFAYFGMEVNAFSFVSAYVVYFGYSVQTGATQALIMTSAFALFRFIGILLSRKLTATSMIFIHLTLLFIGSIILTFFAPVSLAWISLGLFLFGAGCSVFSPSLFTMIECLTSLDNVSVSILFFCGSIASALCPIFMPNLLQLNPMNYVYLNIVSLFWVSLFIFALLIKFGGHNMPLLKPTKLRATSL